MSEIDESSIFSKFSDRFCHVEDKIDNSAIKAAFMATRIDKSSILSRFPNQFCHVETKINNSAIKADYKKLS